ncbi:MAG: APC family permease [Alphaproteobacteria bacterium]|nr:APC family permease [Alphaproteobacteria bacterium]
MDNQYKAGSLTLKGAVAMGTGVMIGAGIFALTGQVAELAGPLMPMAFLVAAVVSAFSAYSYIKLAAAYPSAGGIAMFLQKAYGPGVVTGASALLMAGSMIINESLVARTFATYTMRAFDAEPSPLLLSAIAVALIGFAYLVNISGNTIVERVSSMSAVIKIGGIVIFAVAALWASGITIPTVFPIERGFEASPEGFIAGVAIAILAYKGFTTITNSGGELVNPSKNVGRAIMISLAICLVVYLLVALAVQNSLTIDQIIAAKNYSLAEASRPSLGTYGVGFTIAIAIIATASGLIASTFAVSRMLTMLTEMKLIPHRHFGMTGQLQGHLLVYTVVLASILAAFFDLSRIASLGAIFYLVMDIAVHWGVLRHLRAEIDANTTVLVTAIALDLTALGAFLWIKASSDVWIIIIAAISILTIFLLEWLFLRNVQHAKNHHHS